MPVMYSISIGSTQWVELKIVESEKIDGNKISHITNYRVQNIAKKKNRTSNFSIFLNQK